MKEKLICIVILFFGLSAISQSTNISTKPINVSYIKLPSQPILDDSRRTFSTNSKYIYLHGFSKVNSGASLEIILDYQGIEDSEFEIERNLVENRDDEGQLISSYYTYKIVVDYYSHAAIQVINAVTGETTEQTFKESNTLRSDYYRSAEEAKKYYNHNRLNIKRRYRSEQWTRIIRRIRSYLNSRYGYIPFESGNETVQVLSSKKHPEYGTHLKVYEDLKNIFERMHYKDPIEGIALRAKPIIDTYEKIAEKYSGSKRKEKKLRHASYYNIAKIYYFFDQPEKTRAYALKMIENDFRPSDGRSWLEKSEELEEKFKINQINTRHLNIITEDLTIYDDSPFQEEEEKEKGERNKADEKPAENIIAYLITTANDTIATEISKPDISKIGYEVNLQIKDQNGAIRTTAFKASDCKTLALGNGEMYKSIQFKEASDGQNTLKFAKTLHESSKIELFIYNEKELVLKKPTEENGISTLTSDFIFGLNKKLALYADDCTEVKDRAGKGEFKNNQESLLQFCKNLSDCK